MALDVADLIDELLGVELAKRCRIFFLVMRLVVHHALWDHLVILVVRAFLMLFKADIPEISRRFDIGN